jgi:hypothetical protein
MNIVKIMYEKVFPLAPYVNEKIGVEVEIHPGEDEDSAFLDAKTTVERWHKDGNPILFINTGVSFPIPAELPVIYKNDEVNENITPGISVNDILSCNSLVVLDAYKKLIKDNEHLITAYEKRRSHLVGDGGPH